MTQREIMTFTAYNLSKQTQFLTAWLVFFPAAALPQKASYHLFYGVVFFYPIADVVLQLKVWYASSIVV